MRECTKCEGDGRVWDEIDQEYTSEDCPECEGEGEVDDG